MFISKTSFPVLYFLFILMQETWNDVLAQVLAVAVDGFFYSDGP